MCQHGGNKTRIVYLNAADCICREQPAPFLINPWSVYKKCEPRLKYPDSAIGFFWCQAVSIAI